MKAEMKFIVLSVVLVLISHLPAHAQEMAVPANVQVPLLAKILNFDRNLKSRVGDTVVVGIAYQKSFRTSVLAMEEVREVLMFSFGDRMQNIPVRYVEIDYRDADGLSQSIVRQKVDLMYLTPMRAVDIGGIAAVCQASRVLTLTGVPEYVESGVSVGIGLKGENPLILINLPSARIEGADFNAKLLKLAKVYLGANG